MSYRQFRCVGVIGRVFVCMGCMGYAIRITSHAVDVVSGADQTQGMIAVEVTGVRTGSGLRAKFTGSQLHARKSSLARVVWQGRGSSRTLQLGGGNSPFGTPPPSDSAGSFTPTGRPALGIFGGGFAVFALCPISELGSCFVCEWSRAPGDGSVRCWSRDRLAVVWACWCWLRCSFTFCIPHCCDSRVSIYAYESWDDVTLASSATVARSSDTVE
jgi:hypothetical protein